MSKMSNLTHMLTSKLHNRSGLMRHPCYWIKTVLFGAEKKDECKLRSSLSTAAT